MAQIALENEMRIQVWALMTNHGFGTDRLAGSRIAAEHGCFVPITIAPDPAIRSRQQN